MLNFKCQRCGECCKRYFIISLPHEVCAQARLKGIPEKEFVETNMQLFLQLFPSGYRETKISVPSSMLPKRIADKLKEHLGVLPDFFITMPMLVFKRKDGGACTFFDEKNSGCTIYGERPLECRMFPFISDKKAEDYSKLYPFCHGLKAKDKMLEYVDLSRIHFREVFDYCAKIKENGFSSLWANWPQGGVVLFENKLLGDISEKEFMQAIAPYA